MTRPVEGVRVFPLRVERNQTSGEKAIVFASEEGGQFRFIPGPHKGQPIPADLGTGSLEEAGDGGFIFYKTSSPGELARLAEGGPAQVATVEYRKGWDRIFARPKGAN